MSEYTKLREALERTEMAAKFLLSIKEASEPEKLHARDDLLLVAALREAPSEQTNALDELMGRLLDANTAQGDYAVDDVDLLRSLAGEAYEPLIEYRLSLSRKGTPPSELKARILAGMDATARAKWDEVWDEADDLTAAYISGCEDGKRIARSTERERCARIIESWHPVIMNHERALGRQDIAATLAAAIRNPDDTGGT